MVRTAAPKVRPQMSKDKRASLVEQREKFLKAIGDERVRARKAALDIAKAHGKSFKSVMSKTYAGGNLTQKTRKKTLFNAVIHDTALKRKAEGEGPKGKQALGKLTTEISTSDWRDIPPEEQTRLLTQLEKDSIPKAASKKHIAQDVGYVYDDTKTTLDGLVMRTGCHYLLVIMRDDVKDSYTTHVSTTARVKDACFQLYKATPETMAMKMESYLTTGLTGVLNQMNRAKKATIYRDAIRGHVYESLCALLREMRVAEKDLPRQMEWTSFKYSEIVSKHGVRLDGWTEPEFKNPGTYKNLPPLERIWTAIESEVCRWVRLDKEEWESWKKDHREKILAGGKKPCQPRGSNKNASSSKETGQSESEETMPHGPPGESSKVTRNDLTTTSPVIQTASMQTWETQVAFPSPATEAAVTPSSIQSYSGLSLQELLNIDQPGSFGIAQGSTVGGTWYMDPNLPGVPMSGPTFF
ncbi:hypothetical protein QCA50_020728 [Cerrena zonata]|uniref:Uncharacterized protein n=1 Tax=Cerrena zonata TaxID=2478898 RepID=A0AAW0F913_9APHY